MSETRVIEYTEKLFATLNACTKVFATSTFKVLEGHTNKPDPFDIFHGDLSSKEYNLYTNIHKINGSPMFQFERCMPRNNVPIRHKRAHIIPNNSLRVNIC